MSPKTAMILAAVVLVTAVEILLLRHYLRVFYPSASFTSLKYKMCAATCYLILPLLGVLYCGHFSRYSVSILIALALSWVGDFFLHLPGSNRKVYYGVGSVSFFVGHFFFISAYASAQAGLLQLYVNFYYWQLIVPLIAAVGFLVLFRLLGIRTGKLTVPVFFYALLVNAMAVSAFALAITILQKSPQMGLAPVLMLSLGGLCFLQSDVSLGLSFFNTRYKTLRVRVFTVVTYFTAQTLLAGTIFFLG